jgi:hypothetical protein
MSTITNAKTQTIIETLKNFGCTKIYFNPEIDRIEAEMPENLEILDNNAVVLTPLFNFISSYSEYEIRDKWAYIYL